MLHKESVSNELMGLLEKLMKMDELKEFRLVGGTSLSLQIGHRLSEDIDLFTETSFDSNGIFGHLINHFNGLQIVDKNSRGFTAVINNVKCDFYNWNTKIIGGVKIVDGIRLASIDDIAAMKLDAIITRTEPKDFIDLNEILKINSLEYYISKYKEKYPYNDFRIPLKELSLKIETFNIPGTIKLLKPISAELVRENIKLSIETFTNSMQEKNLKTKQDRESNIQQIIEQKRKGGLKR